ncbi:MAG TPA: hypothetical protein VN661_06605 [Candidatus Acidoferrales bacterium]|nr:hypothetical protein [Candidatus Acidoferrales bacterium]
MRHRQRVLPALLVALALPLITSGGTVSGTVRNGTTGKVATGVDVILIQLQGTMKQAAQTKTDSAGRYHFDNPILGTAPMLIRAVYRGVFYHEPVPPGKATADVEVFEPTNKPSAISISAHALILQPSGSDLTVGEEYSIQNTTKPPLTYYDANGTFAFDLPNGAQLTEVDAAGSSGMPVIQGTIDKGKNREAIAYAFRPGDNEVRVTYKLPYAGDRASLRVSSPYAATRVALLAPPSVQVASDGFSPAGQAQGMNVYMRDAVAANTPLAISVSGTAPAASSAGDPSAGGADQSQNPSVNSHIDGSAGGAPTASLTTMPARLDGLKWALVGGFAALFGLGLIFLWRRPRVAGAAQAAPAGTAANTNPAFAAADQQARGNLDEMKDALFRLELRHQAGTVADDEYARARQRIEEKLRNFVRG